MASAIARLASLVAPPFCWGCGAPSGADTPLCRECRLELRWLGSDPVELDGLTTWAPLTYAGPVRSVVRGLKYRGAPGLAEPIAAAIAAGAPAEVLSPAVALVPVPLAPARRRSRGFNQSERIAVALARRRGLAMADCLRRGGSSRRQVGRDRQERLDGVAGTLSARPGRPVPRRAVLVDDVITTGSTLAACAAALRAAGCEQVAAVAYARTPGR